MDERTYLRDLVHRYVEVSQRPDQDARRDLWRRHNSLQATRPPIYIRAFAWHEMPAARLQCEDALHRHYEDFLLRHLFWDGLGDDSIFEPWLTVRAEHLCSGWGVTADRHRTETRGSFKVDYPIREPGDMERLHAPRHEIDEVATAQKVARVEDLFGDLITLDIDRGPAYWTWSADLSTDLGYLRGIEHFMVDMLDQPQWLHDLLGFMSEGVQRAQQQAETAGDWGLSDHYNQAMAYSQELPDPQANQRGVTRDQLWCFTAAQEFTGVSPAMHEEFLLRHQMPIMEPFGLVAYGCCEDLSEKIDMLRKVPNLRRIAVSPMADVTRCAQQIGGDYVFSYRPSPTDMVGYGLDENRVLDLLRADLTACRDCCVDITLKDVETVEGDPARIGRWVQLCRQVIDEVFV
ncbi:MAG: hypothetical protein HN712_28570 [Gemmatimonadetes bacterium]|jgi:hypothetical protein|nr:hypothetical protein [Gemmatimonadota bacterium]MBT6144135.1 hypothetical protein [Gemmatimonadota bacterium]MBT7864299.1 hypothetical protein [Gemmatimonadota bacterium]